MTGCLPEMIDGVRTLDNTQDYLRYKTLKLFSGSDVCSTPYRVWRRARFTVIPEQFAHCQRFANGALYDSGGELIQFSRRPGRSMIAEVSPPVLSRPFSQALESAPLIEGRSLFLGNWMGHYGHFITEFFSRLWGAKDLGEFDRIFVAPFIFGRLREIKRLNFHDALLNALDIDLDRFELLVDPARFQEVVVPEQGWAVNDSVNIHLRPLYEQCRDSFTSEKAMPEKIFLTRLPNEVFSRLTNLETINAVFAQAGFKVLYPEQMSIKDQFAHYSSCKVMAALSGTLAHNCLFTQKHTRVLELGDLRTKIWLLPMQVAAAQLAEADYVHINYEGAADGTYDTKSLERMLNELGVAG